MSGRLNRRLIGVLCARLPELVLGVLADPRVRASKWPLETIPVLRWIAYDPLHTCTSGAANCGSRGADLGGY